MPTILSADNPNSGNWYLSRVKDGVDNTAADADANCDGNWGSIHYGSLKNSATRPGDYNKDEQGERDYMDDMMNHLLDNETVIDNDVFVIPDEVFEWGYGRHDKLSKNGKTVHMCRVYAGYGGQAAWEPEIMTQHEAGHAGADGPFYHHELADLDKDANDDWSRFTVMGASYGRDNQGDGDMSFKSTASPPSTFSCNNDANNSGHIISDPHRQEFHVREFSSCMHNKLSKWRNNNF